MNAGYAISDLVLALVCAFLAWRAAGERPGVAVACGTIGVAAVVGVVRFSGVPQAEGAHRFLSMIGGTAALPLLAVSLAWTDSKAALNYREAALSLLVGSALGIALIAGFGFPLWGKVIPAASILALLIDAGRRFEARIVAGSVLLLATFWLVSSNRTTVAGLAPIEFLHYSMAAALMLLCFEAKDRDPAESPSTPS